MRKKGIRLIRTYPDAALHGADFRIMSALGTGTAAMVDFPAERTERMEPEAASCRDAA